MKKISLSPPLGFFLAALGIELIRSILTPLSYVLDQLGIWLAYPVFLVSEIAGLLLFYAAIGVGFAVAGVSLRRGIGLLSLEVGAYFIGGLASLVWQAVFLGQGIDPETLTLLIGSAIDSSIAPIFLAFFLGYGIFLSKDKKSTPTGYHDFSAAPVRAALVAAGALFLYQLFGKILYAIEFMRNFSFLNTMETLSMILDFLLVIATSLAGYYVILWARRLYIRAEKRAQKKASTAQEAP